MSAAKSFAIYGKGEDKIMSKIGKKPIAIPAGVEVTISGQTVTVKGAKATLTREVHSKIAVAKEGNDIVITKNDDSRQAQQLWGLSRTLISNMVEGVSKGFEKTLEIQGVGYRANLEGTKLNLSMGYSHPVLIDPPAGITFAVDGTTKVIVKGADKQAVGDISSNIRAVRPPEPYKGKGIRYAGEKVRRKAGKSGKK